MDLLLRALFLLLGIFILAFIVRKKGINPKLESLYQTVRNLIPSQAEKKIPIVGLYVYPIRGIRSVKSLPEIFVCPYGIKYDRELILIEPEKLLHVTTHNYIEMACLSQELVEGSKVKVTTSIPQRLIEKNLPTELTLPLEIDPSNIGEWIVSQKHEGYKYPDNINQWFSTAIEKTVVLVHSKLDRKVDLNPKRHIHMQEGDVKKTFTTDAALHIVNKSSVDELRQRVKDSHPEGLEDFYVEAEQFRPNIVIESGEGFSEDLYAEMRLGTVLLRNAGPTIRCNAIRTNWETKNRVAEEEPNRTLTKFRNVPGLGILFGMYYQQEFLEKHEYNQICPKILGYKSFAEEIAANPVQIRQADNTPYIRVARGDHLKVRLFLEKEWRKQFSHK